MIIHKNTPKEKIIELGKECNKCGHCCSFTSAIFLDEDVKRVADFFAVSEKTLKEQVLDETEMFNKKVSRAKRLKQKERPFGPCIFFDKETGCIINEVKPLHCRVGTCNKIYGQDIMIWFMLNYLVSPNDPESVRQYAAYLKTHPTIPGGKLEEIVPDKKKLDEFLNYEIFR